MEKNDKLICLLKAVITLIYGGLVIASIFLVLWIAITPLLVKSTAWTTNLTASVPVAVGVGETPRFEVGISGPAGEEIQAAFVDEAQGTLRLETTNWYFIFVSNIAKLLTAIGLAYAFFHLRSIFQAIAKDEIFTEENSQRLHKLGYAVLLLSFLRPTIEYIAANEVLDQLTILEPAISLPSTFKVEVLLASLLILIIARVWAYGLELKRDHDLTV